MTDLPEGFILDKPSSGGLPEGFVLDKAPSAPMETPSAPNQYIPNLVSDVAEVGARGIDWAAQQFGAEPRQPQPFSFQRPETAKEDKYFGVIPAVKGAVETAKLPGEVYEGKVDPLSDEGIRRAAEFALTFSPVSPGTLAAGRVLPQAALQTGEHGAMSRFEKALVSDKDTREAMLERLTQARETRPQATIADVGGENVQGLLEDLAQTPGAGRTTVIPRMQARQQYQMARISNDLASITGDNRSAFRAIEQTLEAQKSAATPLYKQAFADGDRAVWNPELERLSSAPVVQDAMRSAVTGWRNQAIADGYGAMNPGSMVERGGILENLRGQVPVFPNIQFWDYTKKALDIQQAAFIKSHGKPSGMLTSITQQLRKSLDEEVPSYAAARRSYAGHAAFLDAIEEGRAILSKKTTAEEFRVLWEGLSESEKEGLRIGAISDIRNRMGQNAAKLPNQTRFVQAPEVRAKLNIMMPSEEVGKRFNQALDYEIGSSELVNRSLRGPATARRLAERQEAERELSAEDALALYSLTHGHALPLAHSMWRRYGKPIQNRMRRNQDAFLAELLTATQPSPAVARALSARKLQRAAPPSPNLTQGIVTGVGAGISGMKSGGYVKVGKASVQYGKGMPSSHCGICKYYIARGKCQRVEGAIRPEDWCKLFEKAASRVGRMQEGGEVPPPEDTAPPPLQGVDPRIQQAWDSGLLPSLGFTQSGGTLSGPADYWYAGSSQPEAGISNAGASIDAGGAPIQAGPTPLLQSLLSNSLQQADALGTNAPADSRVDAFYQANPGATLGDLWQAIPDAGRGSPLGGIGTLHNTEIRDYYNDLRSGATGSTDPSIASIFAQSPFYAGQDSASTNNWRLLPPQYRQPGMIARNGVVINSGTWASDRGFAAGMNPQGGPSAEQGNIVPFIGFGTGARFGYPGLYGASYAPASVGWPGSMTPWFPLESGAMGGGAKRGGRVGGLLG